MDKNIIYKMNFGLTLIKTNMIFSKNMLKDIVLEKKSSLTIFQII